MAAFSVGQRKSGNVASTRKFQMQSSLIEQRMLCWEGTAEQSDRTEDLLCWEGTAEQSDRTEDVVLGGYCRAV